MRLESASICPPSAECAMGTKTKFTSRPLLLVFLSLCNLLHLQVDAQVMKYDITASRASMADLNSAEQTLCQIYSSNAPYHFRISVVSTNYQIPHYNPLKRSYGPEFLPFLTATSKIITNEVNLATLSERLWPSDGNIAFYVTNSLRWVASNIVYDSGVASKVGSGESDTLSSADVLAMRKGSCSEYANLFIALMRYRNIPAAYITGYHTIGSYHAWVEIYLDGPGWVSIDPQGQTIGLSTGHIKLFRSADFTAIHTKLSEIKIKTKLIE